MDMKPLKTKYGQLFNSDALPFIKTLPSNSIDLILTDPPYSYNLTTKHLKPEEECHLTSFEKRKRKNQNALINNKLHQSIDINAYCNEFLRISKNNLMLIFMNHHQLKDYLIWVNHHQLKSNLYIWEKTNPVPTSNFIYQDKEYCLIIYDPNFGKIPNYNNNYHAKKTILKYPIGQEQNGHPTVKPINLIKFLIKKYSQVNDLVFDPFMGSGTTAVACEQLQRQWLGCEISQTFFEICQERLTFVQQELLLD